jgi:hypothetical protein
MGKEMSNHPVWWHEWAPKIVAKYNLKKTGVNHYNGPCPQCIGTDRFYMSEKGGVVRINCNQGCNFKDLTQTMRDDGAWPEFIKGEPIAPMPRMNGNPFAAHGSSSQLYHDVKGVPLYGAAVVDTSIVIKVIAKDGKQVGSQTIKPDGTKRFTAGMVTDGSFAVLNGSVEGRTYLCEGWATAASVALSTGRPAVFCLSSGNLPKVAAILAELRPEADLFVAADNDAAGIKAAKETGLQWKAPSTAGYDWNDVLLAQGAEAVKDALETKLLDTVFTPSQARPILTANYLIKGWLGCGQMSVMYGPSNVGKSFAALDMAWHVASGEMWHGFRVSGGPVLYLATEGGSSFHNRLTALAQKYERTDVPLYIRPSPVDLLRPNADLAEIIALVAEIKEASGQECVQIVVDTVSRAMAGGNENGPEDMTAFISNVDAMRADTGAHCMLVHHSGKDVAAGARGHSSLRAATDTEIEMELSREDGLRFARATKQRDMETGAEFAFKLDVITLGVDQDGDDVTTCVIEPVQGDEIKDAKRKPLTKNGKVLVECFTQLQGERIGAPNPSGAGWPDSGTRWAIAEADLRSHFFGKITTQNKRSTFGETVSSMKSEGHLGQNDGHFWLCASKYKIRHM